MSKSSCETPPTAFEEEHTQQTYLAEQATESNTGAKTQCGGDTRSPRGNDAATAAANDDDEHIAEGSKWSRDDFEAMRDRLAREVQHMRSVVDQVNLDNIDAHRQKIVQFLKEVTDNNPIFGRVVLPQALATLAHIAVKETFLRLVKLKQDEVMTNKVVPPNDGDGDAGQNAKCRASQDISNGVHEAATAGDVDGHRSDDTAQTQHNNSPAKQNVQCRDNVGGGSDEEPVEPFTIDETLRKDIAMDFIMCMARDFTSPVKIVEWKHMILPQYRHLFENSVSPEIYNFIVNSAIKGKEEIDGELCKRISEAIDVYAGDRNDARSNEHDDGDDDGDGGGQDCSSAHTDGNEENTLNAEITNDKDGSSSQQQQQDLLISKIRKYGGNCPGVVPNDIGELRWNHVEKLFLQFEQRAHEQQQRQQRQGEKLRHVDDEVKEYIRNLLDVRTFVANIASGSLPWGYFRVEEIDYPRQTIHFAEMLDANSTHFDRTLYGAQFETVQQMAQARLQSYMALDAATLSLDSVKGQVGHLRAIIDGKVPFGYTIVDDDTHTAPVTK